MENFIIQAKGNVIPKDVHKKPIFRQIVPKVRLCGNAVFGRLNDELFAVSPRYDYVQGKFEVGFIRTGGEWTTIPATKAKMIYELGVKNGVRFMNYRAPRGELKSVAECKQHKEFAKMQANADATFRYRKGQPVQRKLPQMNDSYQWEGQKKYGRHIEMNGKRVYMGKAIVQYMDGPGTGLRPLDTQCFIGTGRKVKFAKAPQ